MLTAERLRELLGYDPATGLFIWREHRGRVAAGETAGCAKEDGYILIRVDKVKYRAHRLAWLHAYGSWPPEQIDHANGVRSDNRLSNLRSATVRQNVVNARVKKNSACGIKGLRSHRGGTWSARIREGGREVNLGTFATVEAAAAAYRDAAIRLHGQFARYD